MVDAKMTELAQSHVLRWMSPAMVTPCPAASDTVWVEENQSRSRLGAFSNLHHAPPPPRFLVPVTGAGPWHALHKHDGFHIVSVTKPKRLQHENEKNSVHTESPDSIQTQVKFIYSKRICCF